MNTRFPRSTREAFASERYAAIERFKRPLSERLVWPVVCILSCIAIGVMLALGV